MGTGVEREINATVSFDSKTLPPSFCVCCLSQRAIDLFRKRRRCRDQPVQRQIGQVINLYVAFTTLENLTGRLLALNLSLVGTREGP